MADFRHLICLDLETSSADKYTTEVLEIGSVAINPYNLNIMDEFHSLVRPIDIEIDDIDQKALDINGLKREDIAKAPPASLVINNWVEWIHKFNPTKNNSNYKAPIACGWGIDNFDLPILDRYFQKFKHWDKKKNWRKPLNPIFTFDVMKFIWMFMRTNEDLNSVSLPAVLEYMGISKEEIKEEGHSALWDSQHTARIAIKLLRLGNFLAEFKEDGKRKMEIKGCLSDAEHDTK